MNRFVWDSEDRLLVGDVRLEPRTANDLLTRLGVAQSPKAAQDAAVNGWLIAGQPDELMKVGLKRKGFRTSPVTWFIPATTSSVSVVPTGRAKFVPDAVPTGIEQSLQVSVAPSVSNVFVVQEPGSTFVAKRVFGAPLQAA